jgi:small subunit ribosomal protein S4
MIATRISCKNCRKNGEKLFLKGQKCFGPNCVVARKTATNAKPSGKRKVTISEYGIQLKEKQKLRAVYGISEKQLSNIYKKALKSTGSTADIFMQYLERRLDNIVFRLGFSRSRSEARQMVSHGHIKVNNKKVTIPSYTLKKDETITLGPKFELCESEPVEWLKIDTKKKEGKVLNIPTREQISSETQEQLIIEYYSR